MSPTRATVPPVEVVRGRLAGIGIAPGEARDRCIAEALPSRPGLDVLLDAGRSVEAEQVAGWFDVLHGCGVGDDELVGPAVRAVPLPDGADPARLACLEAAAAARPRDDLIAVVGRPGSTASDVVVAELQRACPA